MSRAFAAFGFGATRPEGGTSPGSPFDVAVPPRSGAPSTSASPAAGYVTEPSAPTVNFSAAASSSASFSARCWVLISWAREFSVVRRSPHSV